MSRTLPPEVAALLAGFPPPIRAIAADLRAAILSEVPHAAERVRPGWRSLNYHDEGAGFFAAIFPYEDHAGVVFERGAALNDPDGLLEGNQRQIRWLRVRPGERIPSAGLARLLRQALLLASVKTKRN